MKIWDTLKSKRIDTYMDSFMGWLSRFSSDPSSFISVHSFPWFIMGVVGIPFFAYLGASADYEILYAIFYNSSQDESYAFWRALPIAGMIIILIVFAGGKLTYILSNKLLKKKIDETENKFYKDHRVQFGIYLFLFCIATASTIYLSINSDSKARAKASIVEKELKTEKKTEKESYFELKQKNELAINRQFQLDSISLEKVYAAKMEAKKGARNKKKIAEYQGKLKLWEARKKDKSFKSDLVNKNIAECNRQIAYYNSKIDKNIAPLLEEKAAKLLSLAEDRNVKASTIFDSFIDDTGATTEVFKSNLLDLKLDATTAAFLTRWKNVLINLVALLLTIGFTAFKKTALSENGQATHATKGATSRATKASGALSDKGRTIIRYVDYRNDINRISKALQRATKAGNSDKVRQLLSDKKKGVAWLSDKGFTVDFNEATGKLKCSTRGKTVIA